MSNKGENLFVVFFYGFKVYLFTYGVGSKILNTFEIVHIHSIEIFNTFLKLGVRRKSTNHCSSVPSTIKRIGLSIIIFDDIF